MRNPCREPNLDELLDDSAMRLLMASDKVDEAALRTLIGAVSRPRAAAPRRCGETAMACCL